MGLLQNGKTCAKLQKIEFVYLKQEEKFHDHYL